MHAVAIAKRNNNETGGALWNLLLGFRVAFFIEGLSFLVFLQWHNLDKYRKYLLGMWLL